MVGTVQEAVEMKREKKSFEEMSDWEMQQLPRGLRLDIPLKSTQHMKRLAPLLRALANAIETECRKPDLTPVQVLNHIWLHGQSARRIIQQITGEGRRNRPRNNIS